MTNSTKNKAILIIRNVVGHPQFKVPTQVLHTILQIIDSDLRKLISYYVPVRVSIIIADPDMYPIGHC